MTDLNFTLSCFRCLLRCNHLNQREIDFHQSFVRRSFMIRSRGLFSHRGETQSHRTFDADSAWPIPICRSRTLHGVDFFSFPTSPKSIERVNRTAAHRVTQIIRNYALAWVWFRENSFSWISCQMPYPIWFCSTREKSRNVLPWVFTSSP